jgi:hypothetical protein
MPSAFAWLDESKFERRKSVGEGIPQKVIDDAFAAIPRHSPLNARLNSKE